MRHIAFVCIAAFISFAPTPHAQSATSANRGPFDDLHFRGIGPAASGGRIHDLQIDPKNPAVPYVRAASGRIWKATNKGGTWKDVFVQQPDNTVGAPAIFSRHTNITYARTPASNNPQS